MALTARLTELKRWETKAKSRGADSEFLTDVLPADLHNWIAEQLRIGWRLEAVFEAARGWVRAGGESELPTLGANEQEAQRYWQRFDQITDSLSDTFLAYLEKVSADVFERIMDDSSTIPDLDRAFEQHLPELQQQLIGSTEAPGLLARLHIAGQAAGAMLVAGSGQGTPGRAAVTVDFKTKFDEAVQFARYQAGQLITNINSVQRFGIIQAVADAIEQGWPRDRLYAKIAQYLIPPGEKPSPQVEKRAKLIGNTEKIMSYNAGAITQFKAAGVKRAKWSTVSVGEPHICKICIGLHGQEADIEQGWYSNRTKRYYKYSAHPGCRCFRVPLPRVVAPPKEVSQQLQDDPDSVPLEKALEAKRAEYDLLGDQLVAVYSKARGQVQLAQREISAAQADLDKAYDRHETTQKAVLKYPSKFKDFNTPEWERWQAVEQDIERQADELTRQYKERQTIGGIKPNDFTLKIYRNQKLGPLLEQARQRPEYEAALDPGYLSLTKQLEADQAALDKAKKATDKLIKKSQKKITTAYGSIRNAVIETLTGRTTTLGGQLNIDPKLQRGNAEHIKNTEQWLGHLFSKPLERVTDRPVRVVAIKGRAHARTGDIFVNGGDIKSETVVAHEYGHVIEFSHPRIHERCVEFLLSRAKTKTLKTMAELTGNYAYRADEVAFEGHFPIHPYVGKVYRRRGKFTATEVLSMGLEELYRDAENFRKKDPEYFNFIVMLIRDYL